MAQTIEQKIRRVYRLRNRIPDEFWVRSELTGRSIIWFLDQEDGTAGDYETSQERFGLSRDGEIIWGFSSGCSCWDGWKADNYCPTRSIKEFSLGDFEKARNGDVSDRSTRTPPAPWKESMHSNLDDYLLLVDEKIDPLKVLTVQNAEIRRYLIKRIGYENIKGSTNAEVLHRDGTSELLEFNIQGQKERYVKVKDSSTDREYLLYVPAHIARCKQGIAWTFNLREEEYNPIIET